ncbi:hypothetical protein [Allosphingosinicella sp.]|uniref:hypothetical protein n=1 Tax=Allosphingosinicella sp. TaxID=2823234 RepID=UPI00378355CC
MRILSCLTAVSTLVLQAAPAYAACDANNTYSFAFSSVANASLTYGNTYSYTATNPLGATQSLTFRAVNNGLSSIQVNGQNMPRISSDVTSSSGGKTFQLGGVFPSRTASITSNTRTIRLTITFATPVRDIIVNTHDLDFTSNQFRDWLHVTGSDGTSSYVPVLSAPAGNNNGAGARTATGSSVNFGASTSPFSLTSNEGVGNATSADTGVTTGDVVISFAQPVTTVTISYGNFPLQSGESATGQQRVGISQVRFCPMPALAVAKTSAPYITTAGSPDRFNAPGSDVAYTLTVTNSGGSPVDLGSLVLTDVLPPNVTFYNGDYDPAVPGTGPFQLTAGTSGVTLAASGRAYSNNNGSTYAYTPASGYDANVDAVRLTPTGSMAANSSFTIRFRARIN